MQDEWTVIEKEDLECAVAMSLSEQDQNGTNVIGKLHGVCLDLEHHSVVTWEGSHFYLMRLMTQIFKLPYNKQIIIILV